MKIGDLVMLGGSATVPEHVMFYIGGGKIIGWNGPNNPQGATISTPSAWGKLTGEYLKTVMRYK